MREAEDENLALAMQRTCALLGVKIDGAPRRVAAIRGAHQGLRLRHDPLRLSRRRCRRATSRTIAGPRRSAHNPGSFNFAGAHEPGDRRDDRRRCSRRPTARTSSTAVRALDRVLISGFYLIPLFYAPEDWWALWSRVKHPEALSLYGAEPTTWWIEE